MKRLIAMLVSAVIVLGVLTWCVVELPGRPGWGGYAAGSGEAPASVQHIRINCKTQATVRVAPRADAVIRFSSDGAALRWRVRGKTLELILEGDQPGTCSVTVPQTLLLNDLDIQGNTVNGSVEQLVIRDLTLRTQAGDFAVTGAKCIDALVAKSKSGAFRIGEVSARRFDVKTADGSVLLAAPVFQRDCKVISKSGDIGVQLPPGSVVAVRERHGSGSFENVFDDAKTGMRFTLHTRSGAIRLIETEPPQPAD